MGFPHLQGHPARKFFLALADQVGNPAQAARALPSGESRPVRKCSRRGIHSPDRVGATTIGYPALRALRSLGSGPQWSGWSRRYTIRPAMSGLICCPTWATGLYRLLPDDITAPPVTISNATGSFPNNLAEKLVYSAYT